MANYVGHRRASISLFRVITEGIRLMKLYWSSTSPFVRKVTVSAHELGLFSRLETIPTRVAPSKPDLALLPYNPLGQLPTLVCDDGTALYDSLVIIEYLDHLSGGSKLIPNSPAERIEELRLHALCDGFLDLLVQWRIETMKDAKQIALINAFNLKSGMILTNLDDIAKLVMHRPFGLASITLAIVAEYADFRFPRLGWREKYPSLSNWHLSIQSRPSLASTKFFDSSKPL
ncbi:glutathione S-transferase (plasmid) [Bosea vestrisii]|uniref:glutathione S-transferase family protein n=1 Tax=Bosea vestrisii TaxID=151416 RepID=UPI0024E018B1|nr:glutathione S-transferase [Bosea vestrisii]WID99876.1 glutathione S-transferase [Bosea vestrisii]